MSSDLINDIAKGQRSYYNISGLLFFVKVSNRLNKINIYIEFYWLLD